MKRVHMQTEKIGDATNLKQKELCMKIMMY